MVVVNPINNIVTANATVINSGTSVAATSGSDQTSAIAGTPKVYYELSKEWAISDSIVENVDYSSKYYAGKSKEYADSILTDAGFIAVSEDLTNINALAADLTNVDTLVADLTNVDTVAGDISNINAVYADLTNIDSIITNITDINNVAADLTKINSVADDLTNIDSVAADLTNIDSVVSNSTNINACVSNASNINTVAGSISNVNAVGGSISNVNSVAGDLTNIDSVVSNATNINTVANKISNVNTVANNISDVNTVAGSIGDVNTVAIIERDVKLLADDIAAINAVYSDLTNIDSVATDLTNVDTTAGNIANVNTVAGISSNVTTVAGISSDVTAVNNNSSNITSVAGNSTNINTVAGMSSDISSVVTNSTNINTCSTNISDINTCAANIGTISSKVNKNGDTMTGNLTINKSYPVLVNQSTEFDKTSVSAPSSNILGSSIITKDKNGLDVSNIAIFQDTYNNFGLSLALQRLINETASTANFNLAVSPTGQDFVSASSGVKQSITNWAFPSAAYDTLTLGASGSVYTAPADGWFSFARQSDGTNTGLSLINESSGNIRVETSSSAGVPAICLPAKKGDVVTLYWANGATSNTLRFHYAMGG